MKLLEKKNKSREQRLETKSLQEQSAMREECVNDPTSYADRVSGARREKSGDSVPEKNSESESDQGPRKQKKQER
jgi:hypothetical protein